MAFTLLEISGLQFKTSRDADKINDVMMRALGLKSRYAPARLAIARSLSIESFELTHDSTDEEPGKSIRGDTLFGSGAMLSSWVALIIQHYKGSCEDKKLFQRIIYEHWKRGIDLLYKDWISSDENINRFLIAICENAGIQSINSLGSFPDHHEIENCTPMPIKVLIGEIGTDVGSGEAVYWYVNSKGNSPHVAIMGGVGSGKTRTAKSILRQIQNQASVPQIIFDLKGDIRDDEKFIADNEFQVINVIHEPIPLNFLAIPEGNETEMKLASARFQESFSRIKKGGFGANQMDAMRESVQFALKKHKICSLQNIQDALKAEYDSRGIKPDGAMATFNSICQFKLFEPVFSPSEFFSKNWIITFPNATQEIRKIVSYLILDSLDRWLNGKKDSPVDNDGNRALRNICMIDEAHQLLGFKQQALSNLIRMSRSKGGLVMLVSQKPDDFENEDDDFVADVGLFVSFRTNAQPGAAQRILNEKNLSSLENGICICKIGANSPIKIQSW